MLPRPANIGRLVRWNANKKLTFVRTLALELSPEASSRVGQLQGLIGAELSPKVGDALIAHIEDALENGIEEAIQKLPASAGQETIFEAAVAKVNHALSRLLSDRGLIIPVENVNGVLLSQSGKSTVAAVWGEPSILLVRRKTPGNVRIFDVLAGSGEEKPRTGTRRGFTNLVSGALSAKDLMVVANQDIVELLEMEALADILSHGKPEDVTQQLTEALTSRHDDLSLALLLLEGVPEPTAAVPDRDARAERLSPPMRRPAPRKTEVAVVEPKPGKALRDVADAASASSAKLFSGMRTLLAKGKDAVAKAAEKREQRRAAQVAATAAAATSTDDPILPMPTAEPSMNAHIHAEESGPIATVATAGAEQPEPPETTPAFDLKDTVSVAGDAAKHAAHAIADLGTKEGRERIKRLSRERTDRFFERLIEWFNALPAKRRWLLLAALSLILFLNLSVGIAGIQRFRERSVAEYERQLTTIDQKIDSAEASMIYRDEERARRLLEEAGAIAVALPEKTEEQRARKTEFSEIIAGKFGALRRAVPLPVPEVAAAIATDAGTPNLIRLGAYDGILWAADADGRVYRIADGVAEKIGDGTVRADIFVPTRDGVLAGAPEDGLTLLTASGASTALPLDTGDHEIAVNDATTFGSRLYILDAAHNRILRHAAISSGYAGPDMYVKDATDLSSAVSLAIDGYVYVLSKDGAVTRLLRGDRTDFSVSKVDPAVSSALRLRTDAEDGDLYVLDGSPGRIIRFDKETGKLVAQYESEKLVGAKDFVVDEGSRSFLVLDGNQVLRFTWTEEEG